MDPKSVTFRAIVDFACDIIVPAQRGEWFLLSEMLQWIQEEKGAERPEELVLASALELACAANLLVLDGLRLRAPCSGLEVV